MFKIDISYLNAAQISALDTVMSVVVVLAVALVLLVQISSLLQTGLATSYDQLMAVRDDYAPYWSNMMVLAAIISGLAVAAFFTVSLPCQTAAELSMFGGAIVAVVCKLCGMFYRSAAARYGIA